MGSLGVVVTKSAGAVSFDPLNKSIDDFSGVVLFGKPKTETGNGFGYIENLKVVIMITLG